MICPLPSIRDRAILWLRAHWVDMRQISSMFSGYLRNSDRKNSENLVSFGPEATEVRGRVGSDPTSTRRERRRHWGGDKEGQKQRAELEEKIRTKILNSLNTALHEVVTVHAELTLELLELQDAGFLAPNGPVKLSAGKGAMLSGNMPAVIALLFQIEECFFHGLKSDSEFDGVHPFWALLGCIERSIGKQTVDDNAMKLRSSIQEVATVSHLDVSRALERSKAWIREAVRVEALEPFISTITKQNVILHEFYEDYAILRCGEATRILNALLISLTTFDFTNISVLPHSEEVEVGKEVDSSSLSKISPFSSSLEKFDESKGQCSVCTPGSLVSQRVALSTSADDPERSVGLRGRKCDDKNDDHMPPTILQVTLLSQEVL